MISNLRSYGAFGLVCSLFGCSAQSGEQDPSETVEQSSSGLTQPATATLTVTQDWGTGFCANVNVRNTNLHSSQTVSWTVKVAMYSATYTSGWEASYSQSGGTLTINSGANNGVIQPGGVASPLAGFCANRPSGTPMPTVSSAVGNYCGTAYPDTDGDGDGKATGGMYTCGQPAGYSSNNRDCCDSDARAHLGQASYYSTPNSCGNFNYACAGETKEVYGPTGCFEAPITCTLSSDKASCISSAPPAQCNGAFTSYNPGECGQNWTYSAKSCSRFCTSKGCTCSVYTTGGVGGTQRCH